MSRSYVSAAFLARPFGMPIPLNWFGLAAFGMLGALVNPGFWAIGAGLEIAYLYLLSRSERFRAVVDARAAVADATDEGAWEARREQLVDQLDPADRRRQAELEAQCTEIAGTLRGRTDATAQVEGLARLAWLHLRLLVARGSLRRVRASGEEEARDLDRAEADLRDRLSRADLDADLRRTLEQQASVIEARRAAHGQAARRLERVDAELERIRQQVALVREQTLLAADDAEMARSVDTLTASLNEASRWLQQEPDVLAGLGLDPAPPPASILGKKRRRASARARKETT
jgi:hypothetical protein